MSVTIIQPVKGIAAPAPPASCFSLDGKYFDGKEYRISRKTISYVLSICPQTVDRLGIPVARGGERGQRTWYYLEEFILFLKGLEEGLGAIWPNGCLIRPEVVADYLGISMAGLRMMRYRGKGPSYIAIVPGLIRYSKSSVDAYVDTEHSASACLN